MFNILKKVFNGNPQIINKHKVLIGKNSNFGVNTILHADGEIISIGDNFVSEIGVYLKLWGGKIEIGNNVFVGPYSVLYGHGGLKIGNDVLIASNVTFIPANHKYLNKNIPINSQGESNKGINVEDNVWIATGVTILDGINIKTGAVIAAGAVVTKDVPEYSVMAGIPARVVKTY